MKSPCRSKLCLCLCLCLTGLWLQGASAQNRAAPGADQREAAREGRRSDERRRNHDLDNTRARDRRAREHEVKLEARVQLGAGTQAFAQIVGLHETPRTQGTHGKRVTHSFERGQMGVQRARLGATPWSLQVGRVALIDRRAGWWDDELDAIRARHATQTWRLDTGLARENAEKSSAENGIAPASRGVTRWFGQATWPWAPRHALEAFWLVQKDGSSRPVVGAVFANEDATDPSDLRARWIGLRASGEWRVADGPRLAYWADTAWLRGREHLTGFDEQPNRMFAAAGATSLRVNGNALDIGASISLALPPRPSLTPGFARGSSGFRRTGLQENKTRFAGVKRWRRYGERVRPELANLSVATVGAGVRVPNNSSLELPAQRFRQVSAAKSIAGSRLSADPQGTNPSVGREVDLLFAMREWKQVEFTAKASHFKPGAAFAPDQRNSAHAINF